MSRTKGKRPASRRSRRLAGVIVDRKGRRVGIIERCTDPRCLEKGRRYAS